MNSILLPALTISLSDSIRFWLLEAVYSLPFLFLVFLASRGIAKPKYLLLCLPSAGLFALTVNALLTPTTDILDVTVYSLPMIGLYVVSIVIAWFHPIHRRERAAKQRTSAIPQS